MRCNRHQYSPVSVKGQYNICATDKPDFSMFQRDYSGSVLDIQDDDGDTRFL